MLLKDMKQYLSGREQATLPEIAFHLRQDKSVVAHALSLLVAKGRVKKIKFSAPCKGCFAGSCQAGETTVYQYVRE